MVKEYGLEPENKLIRKVLIHIQEVTFERGRKMMKEYGLKPENN